MSLTRNDILRINNKRLAKYNQKYYFGDKVYIGTRDGRLNLYNKDLFTLSDKIINLEKSNLTKEDLLEFDFQDEEDSVVIKIFNTEITSNNIKSFSYIPLETEKTSLDDFKLNGIVLNIENIKDNISFDIRAKALNNASGKYKIVYKIVYNVN